jgi:hypothetical protein
VACWRTGDYLRMVEIIKVIVLSHSIQDEKFETMVQELVHAHSKEERPDGGISAPEEP